MQEQKKLIDQEEFSFIIKQMDVPLNVPENPFKDWLPQQAWARIQVLIKLNKKFSTIIDCMNNYPDVWIELLDSPNGHQVRLPDPFVQISQIQRMCILKALRPGKIPKVIQDFVAQELGEKYIQPPAFSIQHSFQGSSSRSPLLFVLPGTDPMNALLNFSKQKEMKLKAVSLGQGQGIIAEREIEEAKQGGSWVILQNCHLFPSWMPRLEKIVEEIQIQKTHNQFRLWLTSYPSEDLPASIIQTSIKMTNEPPSGLKSNLQVSYSSALYQQLDYSNKKLSKLYFGLSFFHAILQERRNYGPIGFNIYYDFNQSDLFISIRQLQQMAADADIPFYALHYLIGECNYGGRVTDERDRRVVKALLDEYLTEKVLADNYQIKDFPIVEGYSYEEYITQLNNLPLIQPTHLFGFHPNAEIMKDQQYTDEILKKLQLTIGTSYSGGQMNDESKKSDNILRQLCEEYLANFPRKFDIEIANAKYPHDYQNSFNTVFQQEITRFNKLISIIQQSFVDTLNAIKGLVGMSDQLEKITQSFLVGAVPEYWKKYSYPSLKPLNSYLQDFFRRIKYFQNWLDKSIPYVHWISGFFFTQSFLTAVLQNHARKYTIAIDKLDFDFQFLEEPHENFEVNQLPRQVNDGTLIFGLYIEGCKWDYGREMIVESSPKILTTLSPIIWLKPIQGEQDKKGQYVCPVYKTAERKGVLSTTGHSTNFIMNVNMPTDQPQEHWIKRGVALLCQLSI